jgi:hypothetical protein
VRKEPDDEAQKGKGANKLLPLQNDHEAGLRRSPCAANTSSARPVSTATEGKHDRCDVVEIGGLQDLAFGRRRVRRSAYPLPWRRTTLGTLATNETGLPKIARGSSQSLLPQISFGPRRTAPDFRHGPTLVNRRRFLRWHANPFACLCVHLNTMTLGAAFFLRGAGGRRDEGSAVIGTQDEIASMLHSFFYRALCSDV